MTGTTFLTILVLVAFGSVIGCGLGVISLELMRILLVISMVFLWLLTND
jgi:hypothetical protein